VKGLPPCPTLIKNERVFSCSNHDEVPGTDTGLPGMAFKSGSTPSFVAFFPSPSPTEINRCMARATIEKICEGCGTIFTAQLRYVRIGKHKFCSYFCSSQHRPKTAEKIALECAVCKETFYRSLNVYEKRKNTSKSCAIFCSKECKILAHRLNNDIGYNPGNHYGTGPFDYRKYAFNNYDLRCIDCGYSKFESILEVHHLDGEHSNNDIKNLVIACRNCHTERHRKLTPNLNYDGEEISLKKKQVM
jgi:5-methylcytosine-specific restriction endonuclease McrA